MTNLPRPPYATMTIGKRFTFESAHYIAGHETCGQLHGHSWTLDVQIEQSDYAFDKFVLDFKILGGIVKDILRKFDHKTLNDVLPNELLIAETLVEILCRLIRQSLTIVLPELINYTLQCTLQEGIDGGWATYKERN